MIAKADTLYTHNVITDIPKESEYTSLMAVIDAIDCVAQSSNMVTHIFDNYKRTFLYTSSQFIGFSGLSEAKLKEVGADMFIDYISDDDAEKNKMAADEIFKFLNKLYPSERKNFSFSYTLNFVNAVSKKKQIVKSRISVLKQRPNGDVWLVLVTFSLPTKASEQQFTCINHKTNEQLIYDWDEKCWKGMKNPLSDNEKQMLKYAAMGYSIQEIADLMIKAVDTIKGYRRKIFEKLEVDNITEAVNYALANHLI